MPLKVRFFNQGGSVARFKLGLPDTHRSDELAGDKRIGGHHPRVQRAG